MNVKLNVELNMELNMELGIYSCTDLVHFVSFPVKLGNFPEILCYQSGSVWSVDLWNRTEILIQCHIIGGNTSNSNQNHFCPNFAHNVNFHAKLGNFPEILSYQNGSVWSVNLWNRTEILIHCHIIGG